MKKIRRQGTRERDKGREKVESIRKGRQREGFSIYTTSTTGPYEQAALTKAPYLIKKDAILGKRNSEFYNTDNSHC